MLKTLNIEILKNKDIKRGETIIAKIKYKEQMTIFNIGYLGDLDLFYSHS